MIPDMIDYHDDNAKRMRAWQQGEVSKDMWIRIDFSCIFGFDLGFGLGGANKRTKVICCLEWRYH